MLRRKLMGLFTTVACLCAIIAGGGVASASTPKTYAMKDVGTISFEKVTDSKGHLYNGVGPDGKPITNGITARPTGSHISITVKGSISDTEKLNPGDTVSFDLVADNPWQLRPAISNPVGEPVKDAQGRSIFTTRLADINNGERCTWTRTNTPLVGTFNFEWTLPTYQANWYLNSRSKLTLTKSVWHLTDSQVTINTSLPDFQISNANSLWGSEGHDKFADGQLLAIGLNNRGTLNNVLNGKQPGVPDKQVIAFERLTPVNGEIKSIARHEFGSSWELAYDATHQSGTGWYSFVPFTTIEQTSLPIHDWASAAQQLKPGQWNMVRNEDGTFDLAANLGARYGDQRLATRDVTGWDAMTAQQYKDSVAKKVASDLLFRVKVTFANPSVQNSAKATGSIGYKGNAQPETTASCTLANVSNGGGLGQGQSGVIYNGNQATSGSMNMQIGEHDTSVTVSANAFKRTGYLFTGWNTKADGSGTAYQPKANLRLPGEGAVVNLYAQWKRDPAYKATLTYDKNAADATGSTKGYTGWENDQTTIATNGFTYTGHKFLNWNTKANGSGKTYKPGDKLTLPKGTTTLYAQWERIVRSITYDGNDETGGHTPGDTVTKGDDVNIVPNGFTREGFRFTGWNTKPDGTGTAYKPGDQLQLDNDITLYAQWRPSVTMMPFTGSRTMLILLSVVVVLLAAAGVTVGLMRKAHNQLTK